MKKIASIFVLLASVYIIVSLVSSIMNLWQKKDVVARTRLVLDREKSENQKLKDELSQAQKPTFVEEEARNKLFLAKPGESRIILPQASASAVPQNKSSRSNFGQWIDLFFGSEK